MRMQKIATLTFAFIAFLFSCSPKVTSDELAGVYKVRYPYGTEELQLAKDGTYIQSVLIDGESTVKTNKGRWEFKKEESKVILTDAMIVDDFFGHLRPAYWKIEPGLSIFSVKKSFGKLSLLINPDQGFIFKKISK